MKLKTIAAASLLALAPIPALAETIEVQMLNKGEAGVMVFEPRFVSAEVGDTVVFLPADKGHNAESIKGMVPEGQESFKGKISKEVSVELTEDGMMGVECAPHVAMGMVMVIQVGGAEAPEGFLDAKMPKKAKEAFEEILAEAPQS